MPEFTFNEKTHTYYLSGVKIPSVSEIIAPLSDYSNINPDVLQRACRYGSAVHKTIELYLKGTLDEDNLNEKLKQPLAEFVRYYFSSNVSDVKDFELKRYDLKRKFAGTIDLIADNKIIDYKTRKYNQITDDLQLAGYEILAGGKYDKYILELLPNQPYNLVKVNNRQAKSMFLYLLEYWWKTNEFKIKLEQWMQQR